VKTPDPERDITLLQGLIEAFERLGITVEFANLSVGEIQGKGGMGRVRDRKLVILDRNLPTREMNEILAAELAEMDIENLFLPPIVREAVERYIKRNA